MKKEYTKPYIAVESFQLDAAIANSCTGDGKDALGFYLSACTLEDDKGTQDFQGFGWFGNECDDNVIDGAGDGGDDNDGVCYHGPSFDLNDMFLYS